MVFRRAIIPVSCNQTIIITIFVGITLGKNYKEIQNGARIVSVYGDWYQKGDIIMPSLTYQKNNLFIDNFDTCSLVEQNQKGLHTQH